MKTSLKVASTLLLCAAGAYAQQTAFQGMWTGLATKGNGDQVRVELIIDGNGGKLRLTPHAGYVTRDTCLDRDIPVVVNSQTQDELSIAIKGGTVLRGCIDETAVLKLHDPTSMQGTLQDGRTVSLTHK